MRTHLIPLYLLLALPPGLALAEPPQSLPVDSRIKLLEYNEADIYTLMTKFGFQTNVVFSASEEIQTISVGDRSVWQIIPSGHRLFIRPMIDNASTNMTVLTNRRAYYFDIKSAGEDTKSDIVYVAQFVYPEKRPAEMTPFTLAPVPAPAMTPAPAAPATLPPATPVSAATIPAGARNFDYSFSGPDALAPKQVFDDGQVTYIRFRDITQPLPNPYVVDATGAERPAGYFIKDDMMVIERVVGELALKSSSGTIHVFNETLTAR